MQVSSSKGTNSALSPSLPPGQMPPIATIATHAKRHRVGLAFDPQLVPNLDNFYHYRCNIGILGLVTKNS